MALLHAAKPGAEPGFFIWEASALPAAWGVDASIEIRRGLVGSNGKPANGLFARFVS